MDWVSFAEIKKAVSLRMVIDHYGSQFNLRATGPNTLRGRCPLPTHTSAKDSNSFMADLAKGTGGVWSCHSKSCIDRRDGRAGGNALDLVALMERCSVRDAAVRMQEWFPGAVPETPEDRVRQEPPRPAPTGGQRPPKQPASKKTEPEPGEPAVTATDNPPLTFSLKGVAYCDYLRERGIAEETAGAFGIGLFPGKGSMSGRVVIPIHDGTGALVAYAGRAADGSEPRYKFPPGFRKSLELFNLHRAAGRGAQSGGPTAVVVEGFFGCIRIHQAGYPCVAIMGSSLSAEQEELLCAHFGGVVLLFDGDEAGRKCTDDCLIRLGRRIWVKAVVLVDGEEPDSLPMDRLQELIG